MMVEEQLATDRRTFHSCAPDYSKPAYEIPVSFRKKIQQKLKQLYGQRCAEPCFNEIERILKVYYAHKTPAMLHWEKTFLPRERFTNEDIILITYGDLIRQAGEKPLHTMKELARKYLRGVFNTIHILPFFPYSSDRGFAVMDFEEVDPNLGNWDEILDLKTDFKLMFDGVFNHISSRSRWFQEFLNQNPDYLDFFTVFSTSTRISADHLKLIVRPRTSDVLTAFNTLNGKRLVWTTFSPDQIDLNYQNPRVLLKMIEIMLTYVRRGADLIRLDAVTYLWEELGTTCVHLEQTHLIIKLFRDILDAVAPHVGLITETNVAHEDNIRYFGNGRDEAQMVYNFALPPLVLHTFHTADSTKLTDWAAKLARVSDQATYFNFLDSHDGIGLMAAGGLLTPAEIEALTYRVLEHGGYISYKRNNDGGESPYELNITWFSAINREDADEPREVQIRRYLASRAIALVLQGVPGIYLHGLLGSKNDSERVIEERETRSINRQTINKDELLKALLTPDSTTYMVTNSLVPLLLKRIKQRAFHPNAGQRVIKTDSRLFCVLRETEDGREKILALINISGQRVSCGVDLRRVQLPGGKWHDLVAHRDYHSDGDKLGLELDAYQIVWLKHRG